MQQPAEILKTGVTVGNFSPPHVGHSYLITTAAKQVQKLYVLVCHKDGQIDAQTRTEWLRSATPDNCEFIITPDDLPEAPEPWAKRTLQLIDQPINVAFTSEHYGDDWALHMGAKHICVDQPRLTHPISSTDIRKNPVKNFSYLVPAARAALCKRVVLAGAESSGKTTLAMSLADALQTPWVPEYGRLYCEGRGLKNDWRADEFNHIASMQTQMTNSLAHHANNGVLIVDTDVLVTRVWQKRYLPDSNLVQIETPADHYLVCEPVEWHQDGTRESEEFRDAMQSDTISNIHTAGATYTIVSGSQQQRLAQALSAINKLTINLI